MYWNRKPPKMGDMNNNNNIIIYNNKDVMPHILSFEMLNQQFTV